MFHFFEKSLKPTAVPESGEPPAGLVAFYWHFARQAKPLFIGLFAVGFAVALIEVMIPVFIGKVVTLVTASKPEELLATAWPWLLGMAGVLLVLRPLAFDQPASSDEPGHRRECVKPHPLAEPLARLAAVMGVFPERFRRAHRDARDADGAGDPRKPRVAANRRLVHPDLRHLVADPARFRRPLAGAAGAAVVRRLHRSCCVSSCRACATSPK